MASRTDIYRTYQDTYQDHNFPPPRPPPRAYDQYVPPRQNSSYRDEQSFRASSWRPDERSLPYNTRTPSPPRYESARPVEDSWNRAGPSSVTWTDRRSSDSWGNGRRRDPTADRFLEPSDAWKQNHHDPRNRQDEYAPPAWDRYLPPRDTRDYEPSVSRSHYSPPSGDRYRPMMDPYDPRELFPHSRADSYRPIYDTAGPWVNPPPLRVTRTRSPSFNGRPLPLDDRHYSPPAIPPSSMHYRPHPQRMRHNRNMVQRISSADMRRSPSKNDLSPTSSRYLLDSRSTPDSAWSRHLSAYAPSVGRKRSSSPSRREDESPFKRHRSLSPDHSSSLASSRRSSPAPVVLKETSISPDDHRSPRASEEGMDHDTDMEEVPGIVPIDATLVEGPPMGNDASSFKEDQLIAPVTPPTQHPSDTPPPELRPRSPTPPALAVDPELPVLNLLLPDTSAVPDAVEPPTVRLPETDGDASKPAVPDSKSWGHTALDERPLREPGRPPRPSVEIPTRAALPVTPPLRLLDVQMEVDEAVAVTAGQGANHFPPAKTTLRDALIHVVASRAGHDRRRRDERVAPILLSNLSIAEPPPDHDGPATTLMQDFMESSQVNQRQERRAEMLHSSSRFVEERRADVDKKVAKLKAEYLELQKTWLEHCAKLDEEAKANSPEDTITTSGRTTRRSAATLGDAVRSDLEMEQIIASLGNEDLTDANHLAMRNAATLPDMISVTRGYVDFTYDDTNNLVLDAPEFYRQRTGVDDWTEEEKHIFLKAYAAYPKQFGIIADSLPNKTAAQCVVFYYLHKKKHIDFRKVIQHYAPKTRKGGRRTDKQRGNALLADIMRHDAEVSHGGGGGTPEAPKKRRPGRPPNPRRSTLVVETPNTTPTPVATPDPEPVQRSRAGRRVSARAPLVEDEATEEEPDEPRPAKKRRGRKPKNLTSDATSQPQSQPEAGGAGNGRRKAGQQGNWSEEDQRLFIELVAQHGDNFKRVASSMPNKTTSQVCSFYKANADKYDLAKVVASAPQRTPTPRESMSDRSSVVPSTRAPTPPSPDSTSKPPSNKRRGNRDREASGSRTILPNYQGSTATPPSISTGQRPGFPAEPPVTLPPIGSLLPQMTHPPPPGFREEYVMSNIIPPPPVHIPSGFMGAFPSAHHETYYNPIPPPIPYGHAAHPNAPPVIMIPEHTGDPPVVHAGATHTQGESFLVRDYQHSRAQRPSVGVIPGLVDIPSFDPQYHQPVIRVQQQESRQEPQTSQFMTGRVLLQTKAYTAK